MIRGLDVSHYQGAPNWASLRDTLHISWGACKATEGTGYVDSEFHYNWAALKAAGLGRAAYHYAHPELSASVQAEHFVSTVHPVAGDVLVLDLERGTTQQATHDWAATFSLEVHKLAPGAILWLYMGMGYAGTDTGRGLSKYYSRWWLPHYYGNQSAWPTTFAPRIGGNVTGWPAPHIWQWSQALDGKYDADVSTLTFEELTGAGADMPLTPADIPVIKAALDEWTIPSKRVGTPGKEVAFGAYISSIDVNAANALAVANAVNAALPQITQALIAALPAALAQAVVDVNVNVNGTAVSQEKV